MPQWSLGEMMGLLSCDRTNTTDRLYIMDGGRGGLFMIRNEGEHFGLWREENSGDTWIKGIGKEGERDLGRGRGRGRVYGDAMEAING